MATRLCAFAELATGVPLRVELDDLEVAVVKVGEEVFAIEDVCSHADIPLSEGDVDDCTIECALHGSRFDLRTGKPTGPPAVRSVPVYPVTVDGQRVLVDLDSPL